MGPCRRGDLEARAPPGGHDLEDEIRQKRARRLLQDEVDRVAIDGTIEARSRNAPRHGEANAGSSMLVNVKTTSADVSSWPSWKRTPSRSRTRYV